MHLYLYAFISLLCCRVRRLCAMNENALRVFDCMALRVKGVAKLLRRDT